MTIAVLLVDDDALVRAGLRMMIETQDDLVVAGEADNGRDAIRLAGELRPDVVLMDIRMPDVDGPRVVILTTFELDDYVYEAVRAGASGFLLKRTPPEEILDAIRVIHRGDSLLSPSVTKRLMREFARAAGTGAAPTDATSRELDLLTDREREVLLHIARGLTNREIADTLYVGESTVKTHVRHILTKLDLRDRIHAVVLAYETGLVAPRDP